MDNIVFYGFQFPHHGRFSAFSALSRGFEATDVRVCRMKYPQMPQWCPGRVRGSLSKKWFQLNEYRLKSVFSSNQLVHYFFPENSLFKAARWKKASPLVLSCHQPIEALRASSYMQINTAFYEGMKAADRVVLMASCEIDEYRELAPNSEVLCIPHGVDTDYFSPATSSDAGISDGLFNVLTVGNWLRDYEQWAEVAKKMTGECPEVEFTVIANPERLTSIREYLGGDMTNIRLLSGITDEELRNEYRRADVVFLPLMDAWANNALLESMSCGCPLLVTDLPAIREYAGEAACLVQKNDADAVVHKLLNLRDNPRVRDELGRFARVRMEREYRWEHIVHRHLDLYSDLMD